MNGKATGTNLDTVRRHNLATVLGLVHREGPLARSALTQATGLNRSTVGALVAELAELGLVQEREPELSNRVGRPSPVVAPDGRVVALAINPEIDAVTVGVVGLDGTVRRRVRYPTGHIPSAAEAVAIAAAVVDGLRPDLAGASRVVGIGVAVPGLVREEDGVVRLAPHLEWAEEPFAAELAAATGYPVLAANDASLGANAERLFGAGRGASDLVYLNGGASGIGAGVIVSGSPLTGISGYAGELGHTLVNSAGVRCHCGAIGCLETEVSQSALLRVLRMEAADPEELDRALSAAIDAGDPAVAAEVDRQVGFLATALRNATNVFDPQLIVLGGFLGALHALDPDRLPRLVGEQALAASAERLSIVRAGLGSDILMIGAAELAFGPLLAAPAS
ncbi:ROK family transcriptional regulator [Leifsonia sp. 21MFCrub1.1]|uniref:ROK family transcriptional regulator n=1 Tax=Leifsonia sp. 21MFCrub1.1 TaxID=1798223 RepID=UPI0008928851|nr:ROK family transcriptional regulator [Leifsonia sp. 21MFCrub1.1]SEB02975.1 Sugar kinase of the NBD/HSP70 family, may contain an N-terminal HTH domain [Leifsonia sp. 21MFCrub1.1]